MFKVTEFVRFMVISGSEDRTVTSVSAESDIRKFEKVMSPISSFECELNECARHAICTCGKCVPEFEWFSLSSFAWNA